MGLFEIYNNAALADSCEKSDLAWLSFSAPLDSIEYKTYRIGEVAYLKGHRKICIFDVVYLPNVFHNVKFTYDMRVDLYTICWWSKYRIIQNLWAYIWILSRQRSPASQWKEDPIQWGDRVSSLFELSWWLVTLKWRRFDGRENESLLEYKGSSEAIWLAKYIIGRNTIYAQRFWI